MLTTFTVSFQAKTCEPISSSHQLSKTRYCAESAKMTGGHSHSHCPIPTCGSSCCAKHATPILSVRGHCAGQAGWRAKDGALVGENTWWWTGAKGDGGQNMMLA